MGELVSASKQQRAHNRARTRIAAPANAEQPHGDLGSCNWRDWLLAGCLCEQLVRQLSRRLPPFGCWGRQREDGDRIKQRHDLLLPRSPLLSDWAGPLFGN